MLSGKFLRRISIFDDVFRGIAVLGIPQHPTIAEKIIITITPVMKAARPPFSPQTPRNCLRGGGGGGTGYRLRYSFRAKRKSRPGSTRSIQLRLSPADPRVRPLGYFLPPPPPPPQRLSRLHAGSDFRSPYLKTN